MFASDVLCVANMSFWDWLSVTASTIGYFWSVLPPSLLAAAGEDGALSTFRFRSTIRVAAKSSVEEPSL